MARALHEGDEVAGFTVLETPGHSVGHISLWRESDRVLIVGDVLGNMNFITGIPGLHAAARRLHPGPRAQPRVGAAAGRAAPALACFGHGAPLRDPDKLSDFVARLPLRAATPSRPGDASARSRRDEREHLPPRGRGASPRPSTRAARGTRARCTAARPRR